MFHTWACKFKTLSSFIKSFFISRISLKLFEKYTFFEGTRRYYNFNTIEILKFIKFLLKSEGITINGVKKYLNQKETNLDDSLFNSIRAMYLKNKLINIKNIIKRLKK